MEQKAQALVMYPRVRLGNDNMGLCKLPWVDVFNPESAKMKNTDIYINPASQEHYADFYNGMLGTGMTWQEIFEQTDRDINLQRVMNVMVYGTETAGHDRIPDRAVGPTEDASTTRRGRTMTRNWPESWINRCRRLRACPRLKKGNSSWS